MQKVDRVVYHLTKKKKNTIHLFCYGSFPIPNLPITFISHSSTNDFLTIQKPFWWPLPLSMLIFGHLGNTQTSHIHLIKILTHTAVCGIQKLGISISKSQLLQLFVIPENMADQF